MEDYQQDGYNAGGGEAWRNNGHASPQTDAERYDYSKGYEHGARRRQIGEELDREFFGDNY